MPGILKQIFGRLPRPDGLTLSWPPGINFPLQQRGTLQYFERLAERSAWTKELIQHKTFWICRIDNAYQIDLSAEWRDFSEDWTDVYPNRTAFFQPVLLKIGSVTVKETYFVYCDETRIFVPVPQRVVSADLKAYHYEWDRNSLDFKLARIIGHYHIYRTIEGVAKQSHIRIVNGSRSESRRLP